METEAELEFAWDDENVAHIARHRISPQEVERAFRNGTVEMGFENIDGEPRWKSLGHTDRMRVLMFVWTMRGSCVRPITAMAVSRSVARSYWTERNQHD